MTATLTSKLPTSDRPVINDRDLATAVEKLLAPLTGAKLEKAQAAVRRIAKGAATGSFSSLVDTYKTAIAAATRDKET